MKGRLEHDLATNNKIQNYLKDKPQFLKEWYVYLDANNNTPRSCYEYLYRVTNFLRFVNDNDDIMDFDLSKLNVMVVQNYMRFIKTRTKKNQVVETSDSFRELVWSSLNNFFKFMKKHNYITENYIEDIKRPKNNDLERINANRLQLTSYDLRRLLEAVQERIDESKTSFKKYNIRDKAILLLFINTGMRETALTEINLEDIDLEECTLQVLDKGRKKHLYYLNDDAINAIKEWLNLRGDVENDALFLTYKNERLTSQAIRHMLAKYSKDAFDVAISPHKLRSAFCSILYDETHDIEFVRRAVGHSNVETTQRYIVTDGKEKKKASQIMQDLVAL